MFVARARIVLPLAACLSACPSPPANDTDTSTTTTGTSETVGTAQSGTSTSPTGPEPTTTGPSVCSDGVVGGGEACDDDNDDNDDGCAADCARSGVALWTYTYNGPANQLDGSWAVAVDADGRTVVAGYTLDGEADGFLVVLDPTGAEVWKKIIEAEPGVENGLTAVAVDDAGNIYAGGYVQGDPVATINIYAFDPAGGELWTFSEPGIVGGVSIDALEVRDGALFSAGLESMEHPARELVVRRHQLADGAVVWKSKTTGDKQRARAAGLAFSGTNVVAVGEAYDDNQDTHPIVAVFDAAGALVSTTVAPHNGTWYDAAAIGPAGDIVLIGDRNIETTTAELLLRRIGPDGAEIWTQARPPELDFLVGSSVAVAGEEIVVSGFFNTPDHSNDIFAARFHGDGSLLWTSTYDNPEAHLYDLAVATAFGPDFVVIAGNEETLTEASNLWVRSYAAD